MAIKFSEPYRHERLEFFPGVSLGFEDPDAEPFFIKVGVAEEATEDPVRVYSQDEVSIDPETVFADGTRVLDIEDGEPGAAERQRSVGAAVQPHDQVISSES